ncbi:Copper-resistance protein [Parasponia andersonii]|uniref:Copper-resistance protein n=1 Tax=Parasponia andersonii TaxID=3476 RepID=A0A2P5BAQ3_PARAD|nr:Copper-resistance protein [Parasponia andersonii]
MGRRRIGLMFWIYFLDGLLRSMASSIGQNYTFVLREKRFTRLCTTKHVLTVNGMIPGPTIHVRKGQAAFITVHNEGNYGITIHWYRHGVKQPRNPCSIQPGKSFTYQGTLWWHAHSNWSRATVHGPIIILPQIGKTYPFPKPHAEQTIILGSWFNGDVKELIDEALATGGNPNISDAFTINGWPGALHICSYGISINNIQPCCPTWKDVSSSRSERSTDERRNDLRNRRTQAQQLWHKTQHKSSQ